MRYPFALLAEAMGCTEAQAARQLGLSGSTEWRYRSDGLTEKVADRLAVKAGFHAFVVWPEMLDAVTESVMVECAADGCETRFLPRQNGHKYCSRRCGRRMDQRRYRATQRGAEVHRAISRRQYADTRDYVRRRHRAWYEANREEQRERRRQRYVANRERELAYAREYRRRRAA